MCGRYAITASAEHLAAVFDAMWEQACLELAASSLPRFNVAPTQSVPVVRQLDAGRVMSLLRWGLVPSWADDPAIGGRLINARAESASTKPSFRIAWRRRRCLVPITHYYEWQKSGAVKQPMAICSTEEEPVLALAGLWESWRGEFESFTILTTAPTPAMRRIHDRMPVVLPRERWARWLDPVWSGPEGEQELAEWTAPAEIPGLRAYPVSTLVNSPRNESSGCLEPLSS